MRPVPSGFKSELLVLYYAMRSRATPFLSKAVAALSLLYLLSPVDIIPDFIPFAGWVDDAVVVPLLLHLSFRLLPARVVQESRLRAAGRGRRLRLVAWGALIVVLLLMTGIYWYYHSRG